MEIKCIIIDDEPIARKGLREYIADIDFLSLEAEFDSPVTAAGHLGREEPRILFLDIQMPRLTGIDFLKSLKDAPPVIFTTAYPQYALDSYDLNALDYLVKPISFDRFLKAALKAKEYYEIREKNSAVSSEPGSGHFFIKSDSRLVKILFSDILYVEAMQNYVVITTTQKKHITYLTFRSVEDYLPTQGFIKTHKSFIVAADKVDSIEGNLIRIGKYEIPVSRNLKEEVMEKLLKGRFLRR